MGVWSWRPQRARETPTNRTRRSVGVALSFSTFTAPDELTACASEAAGLHSDISECTDYVVRLSCAMPRACRGTRSAAHGGRQSSTQCQAVRGWVNTLPILGHVRSRDTLRPVVKRMEAR
jgi:hypothetical protein